jgi:TatD DNase family protein
MFFMWDFSEDLQDPERKMHLCGMVLADTHTHLFLPDFKEDLNEVVRRAGHAGVQYFLIPNIDTESVESVLDSCSKFPQFRPMWGLHPCYVGAGWMDALEKIKPLFFEHPACAVGEIGLDFYWSREFTAEQVQALEVQLQWAVELNLPVSLHTREATPETIALVRKYIPKGLKGVFHCFSGSEPEAKEIIDLGMLLGIGGSITYPKNPVRNFIARLPVEALVLETDAPYLPPVPYRGKRNEPAWLMEIVHQLAALFQLPPAQMAEITTANAKRVFNL